MNSASPSQVADPQFAPHDPKEFGAWGNSAADDCLDRPTAVPALLVADDEPAIRKLLTIMLEPLECAVHVAVDGSDAIEQFLIEPHRFGAAVLDVSMPNRSGVEVMHALRAVRPEIPVFLITGTPDRIPAGSLPPGVHVILKPFECNRLVERIGQAMGTTPHHDA